MGVPNLPVVVERGGVERAGHARHHVGKPERIRQLERFVADGVCVRHAHVREKVAGQIVASQRNAEVAVFHGLEQARRNALRGFSGVIAGKHAVDIGVVNGPKALSDVHREGVGRGDYQNARVLRQEPALFGGAQALDELRADERLLNFVSAGRSHHGDAAGRIRRAELGGAYRKRLAIGGVKGEQGSLSHWMSPRMRARREPGYTMG